MRRAWMILAITATTLAATADVPPNLHEALEAQRQLAASQPQDAEVLNDLGNLLLLAGETQQAEAAYQSALSIAPERDATRYNLALLIEQRGDRKAAMREYHRVLKSNPDHAWAHYRLGALHEEAGRRERAIQHYARAFALGPELTSVAVNPHIVRNTLTTEAILTAYRSTSTAESAPRLYQQPSRVAELLIPPPPPEPEPEAAEPARRVRASWSASEEEEERPEEAGEADEAPARDQEEDENLREEAAEGKDDEGPEAEDDDRILTEEDLPRSVAGQVRASGAGGSARGRGADSPESSTSGRSPAGVRTAPGATFPASPRPGPTFRPGIQSTGRLDLQILSPDSDRLAWLASGELPAGAQPPPGP